MKKPLILILLLSPLFPSCASRKDRVETWKKEIIETEEAFSTMARKEGIPEAFLAFAAEDVVLERNNRLVIGREAMRESFEGSPSEKASLSWTPDFVDVASSGDLGYTYGKYTYTLIDSLGNENVLEGIFHTVWKRQKDGSWRFVWD